jgi:hypothetical protein
VEYFMLGAAFRKLAACKGTLLSAVAVCVLLAIPFGALALTTLTTSGEVLTSGGTFAGNDGNPTTITVTFDPTLATYGGGCTAGQVCILFNSGTTVTTISGSGAVNFTNKPGSSSWLTYDLNGSALELSMADTTSGSQASVTWNLTDDYSQAIPNPLTTNGTATEYSTYQVGNAAGNGQFEGYSPTGGTSFTVSGVQALSAPKTVVSVPGRGGIFGWTRGVGCGVV